MKSFTNKTIWLIGGSSGIGEALARKLAGEGAKLVLSARSEEKLQALNGELGGGHAVLPLDVSDDAACEKAVETLFRTVPKVDSVLFFPAFYDPGEVAQYEMSKALKTVDVNLSGALRVLYRVIPKLLAQGHGQIGVCASVAGYRGLPEGQPYCATKAALINLTESMRVELQPKGLDIRIINPGFVKTRLTDKNDFAMPMMVTPEKAADYIVRGLKGKRYEIVFPPAFAVIFKLICALPAKPFHWLMRKGL